MRIPSLPDADTNQAERCGVRRWYWGSAVPRCWPRSGRDAWPWVATRPGLALPTTRLLGESVSCYVEALRFVNRAAVVINHDLIACRRALVRGSSFLNCSYLACNCARTRSK